jgi:hypothetical protein
LSRVELHRPRVIEKNERSDHAALPSRQHSGDFETAEVARPRLDF